MRNNPVHIVTLKQRQVYVFNLHGIISKTSLLS